MVDGKQPDFPLGPLAMKYSTVAKDIYLIERVLIICPLAQLQRVALYPGPPPPAFCHLQYGKAGEGQESIVSQLISKLESCWLG